jgi:hypothetical protein
MTLATAISGRVRWLGCLTGKQEDIHGAPPESFGVVPTCREAYERCQRAEIQFSHQFLEELRHRIEQVNVSYSDRRITWPAAMGTYCGDDVHCGNAFALPVWDWYGGAGTLIELDNGAA